MVLFKLLGIGLMALGFWLVRYFPGSLEHQRAGFGKSGIFIGILTFIIGLVMLLVG